MTNLTESAIEIVFEVEQTEEFLEWLAALRDIRARARILTRLQRFALGNLGDVKSVGHGVYEARITYGPGYRLYFLRRGDTIILLLCGGTKQRQDDDIDRARQLAEEYDEKDNS